MDYQEAPVAGKRWKRCYAINIKNQLGQTPSVEMFEEVVTTLEEDTFKKSSGSLQVLFDPSAEIPLLDPTTGLSLGVSMTQGQIHVALWSLYMMSALARDAALVPVDPPIDPPIDPPV